MATNLLKLAGIFGTLDDQRPIEQCNFRSKVGVSECFIGGSLLLGKGHHVNLSWSRRGGDIGNRGGMTVVPLVRVGREEESRAGGGPASSGVVTDGQDIQ